MLRIAEYNTITGEKIDLKELEKYGFVKSYYVDEYVYTKQLIIGTHYKEEIIVWIKDKEIQVSNAIRLLGTLHDLIKDGLVENVEGKSE